MLKHLVGCIREYKKATVLTLIFIIGEAIIETIIPFVTADLVNLIKKGTDMSVVMKIGLVLTVLACLSLACGAIAGLTCSRASSGFA